MTEPSPPKAPLSPSAKRLSRTISLARAADFWERLWRGLISPLVVVGLFLCVSWLGLWLEVPHGLRAVGMACFALLLAASTFGLWRLAPLSRREALRRIDQASGLAHRPASVLDDTLATAGRDPATDALWALHKRRAEADAAKLKPGRPAPRVVDLDRYALRAGILVALVATAIVAGPQRYARVAAAFDFGASGPGGPGYRLDAWIDPPPYTGKPPVLLDLAGAGDGVTRKIAAAAGSLVIIRSSGGMPADVEATGPLLPPPAKPKTDGKAEGKADVPAEQAKEPPPGDGETKLVLHGDSHLVLRQGGSLRGTFDLAAIPDKPPTVVLSDIPKANARGTLTLKTTTNDDYGVSAAEALFANPKIDGEPVAGPSLVPAPKAALALPGATKGIGNADTILDLSEHPWAGATVTMTLVARDEGGNEGRSEPVEITLPQKVFNNPVARALVEQRRTLVLDPGKRAQVATALDALMIEPQAFGTKPSIYLGLRFAADSLANARSSQQLVEVADFLWGMALQLENGDLTDAEKALRDAEKALRDAIENRASDEDIQKLTQNLQAAMDKFLKELAEQQQKDDQQQAQQQGRQSKSISQKDLQKLLDRLREQARSGNREEAKKALDELQDILENLKTAKRQKADPQARAMAEGLNQLDQMMRDQQDLRDETFKQGQDPQGQQPGQQQGRQEQQDNQGGDSQDESEMPGGGMGQRPGQGQRSEGGKAGQDKGQAGQQPGQGQSGQGQSGQGKQTGKGQSGKSLGQRQQELSDRLDALQKKLKQAGQGQGALDDAGRDMTEAEDALKQGEGANGQAVDAQGRALDALRKGAKKLADAMQQQGDPNGQANAESEGEGQGQASREGEQSGESDPLGRPRGGHSIESSSRFNPMGIPAAQRAQRVLEELRKRLADPTRSQAEIDYLERLLRSY